MLNNALSKLIVSGSYLYSLAAGSDTNEKELFTYPSSSDGNFKVCASNSLMHATNNLK